MTIKRPYTSGHFELLIDGHKTTSFLKAVDGGFFKQAVVAEPTGGELGQLKHGGVWDIDPVTIDFGLAGAKQVLQWIQGSWRKEWSQRSGEIIHADFNLKTTLIQEFTDALILETTFPTLDGGSKEGGYLKVKFQPEKSVMKKKTGTDVTGVGGVKQKQWLASSFRLNIDGIDELSKVNKIESFTIKQGVKKFYVGQDRFPTLTPTKIEFPNLVCTIGEVYASSLMKWHEKNSKGNMEKDGQLTGSLEFLNAAKESIFSLNLYDVGLLSLATLPSTANEDKIKRIKFELFVGRMDLDGGGALGLE